MALHLKWLILAQIESAYATSY